MKKKFFWILLLFVTTSQSQTYLKVNAFTTLLTVPNIAMETSIGNKTTFNLDIMASFWKSVNNKPREFYSLTPEFRYHFKAKDNGFYLGAHFGGSIYNFQKWNYLNTDYYEKGVGYFAGATIGYKAKINERFLLDCFLGGGWHHGFYKGYRISDGSRYEHVKNYNKSGEWLPYRGGVMVSYRLH
ncbi:DUF3575 domain-containing protein [Flavobacterium crassostreae]|uniref:DUF3575 domain-containing protein n=1 Tax=Flavobacterium crassostreae TaxID=1763534 RepID=A0A1B9DYS6_9FLAO|nr:DUF3575 domain-containing protein [Flavobacterium crassostreae]OCB74841.1 hypothetical protein LPBF_09515 [Flavobacterium crassostreae]